MFWNVWVRSHVVNLNSKTYKNASTHVITILYRNQYVISNSDDIVRETARGRSITNLLTNVSEFYFCFKSRKNGTNKFFIFINFVFLMKFHVWKELGKLNVTLRYCLAVSPKRIQKCINDITLIYAWSWEN